MNSAIQRFGFDGVEVRVQVEDGEPWFCAADVCRVLGLGNTSKAADPLDDDEKGIRSTDTLRGSQGLLHVTEAGLYRLILCSRKPEAKRFSRWVTHEVLPAIRRTGGYGDAGGALTVVAEQLRYLQNQMWNVLLAELQDCKRKLTVLEHATQDRVVGIERQMRQLRAAARLGAMGRRGGTERKTKPRKARPLIAPAEAHPGQGLLIPIDGVGP